MSDLRILPHIRSVNSSRAAKTMNFRPQSGPHAATGGNRASIPDETDGMSTDDAVKLLEELASVSNHCADSRPKHLRYSAEDSSDRSPVPHLEAKYQALIEQIPPVIFMAYLDRGVGEAYVKPADRGGARVLAGGVAGRPGPVVSPYSSPGQTALE